MANPITWRNVAAPNFSGVNQGLTNASNMLDRAFSGVQQGIDTFQDQRENTYNVQGDENTQALMQRLAGIDNYDALQSQQGQFTDTGLIGQNIDSAKIFAQFQDQNNQLKTKKQNSITDEANTMFANGDLQGAHSLLNTNAGFLDNEGALLKQYKQDTSANVAQEVSGLLAAGDTVGANNLIKRSRGYVNNIDALTGDILTKQKDVDYKNAYAQGFTSIPDIEKIGEYVNQQTHLDEETRARLQLDLRQGVTQRNQLTQEQELAIASQAEMYANDTAKVTDAFAKNAKRLQENNAVTDAQVERYSTGGMSVNDAVGAIAAQGGEDGFFNGLLYDDGVHEITDIAGSLVQDVTNALVGTPQIRGHVSDKQKNRSQRKGAEYVPFSGVFDSATKSEREALSVFLGDARNQNLIGQALNDAYTNTPKTNSSTKSVRRTAFEKSFFAELKTAMKMGQYKREIAEQNAIEKLLVHTRNAERINTAQTSRDTARQENAISAGVSATAFNQ